MKLPRLKAIGIAAGVAAFAFIGTPVSAGTVTGVDGDGVDFDAACVLGTSTTTPGPNNIGSPGAGCTGISTYDGSTESTDLRSYTLDSVPDTSTPSDVLLSASWTLEAALPAAGSTCSPTTGTGGGACPDLPDRSFVGFGFKTLFQNPADQNNLPTTALGGGCARVNPPGGQVIDQHGHWADGYHHFIGFDAVWDGTRWIHSAQIGTYDPSPDGAFFFTELGYNNGVDTSVPPDGISDWQNSDPAAQYGVHWDVTYGPGFQVLVSVDGVVPSSNSLCDGGVFNTVYAKANDLIINIKALSTADSTVTVPVTIPLSLVPGFSDITSIGGFIFFSDITLGNSANTGVVGGTLETHGLGIREDVSYTGGFLGISDTLGDSPACPTPTFGGTLPPNPFKNPLVGCQYDDDNIPVPGPTPGGPWTALPGGERGTFFSEWWDTIHKITA